MCGFVGLVRPGAARGGDPERTVRDMTGALQHRGPDDEGVHVDHSAGVYLGFRRLAILDLSAAGHQPMACASGRYVVTFNGEIYNFQQLRADLAASGARFRGGSDTEVLLAAVERWGCEGTLPRLRGMFAFALWDVQDRELWLARDRMGIKPLYFLSRNGALAFASEARAFHFCPLYEGRGNPGAAARFLQTLRVPGESSLLDEVEKVQPGEVLRFKVGGDRVELAQRKRYWDLRMVAMDARGRAIRDEEAAVEGLLDVLREAVRLRLVADVPVGAFLSGGIDSSAVVGLMQEQSRQPVKTFTIAFGNADFDEGPAANAIANHLGTNHTSVAFTEGDVLNLVPTLSEVSDEPMANPSLLPTLLVSRVAREQVVVALSGDGGDELFGGYNRYRYGARMIRGTHRAPRLLRRGVARLLNEIAGAGTLVEHLERRRLPGVTRQHPLSERVRKVARVLAAEDERAAYESLMSVGIAAPPIRSGVEAYHTRMANPSNGSLESWMMLEDQLAYLPEDLLTKVDRASMWESLEARVPILDHLVVEYSWRLPARIKIRDGVSKWPLRQVAERYVPRSLLDRPKMGFTAPVGEWLRGGLREWARDLLEPAGLRSSGLWDVETVDRMWREFEGGRTDLALGIWTAAVLQAWIGHWKVSFA